MNEIVRLYKLNKSFRQIAKIIHRGTAIISKTLKDHNILIRIPQKGPINKNLLIKKYILEKRTTYTIANEIGRCQENVLYWLKKYGIKRRKRIDYPGSTKGKKRPDLSKRNRLNRGEKHSFWGKKRPDHSKKIRGKNHPNWKGGISKRTDKLRHKYWKELENWRKEVFIRDDYTCQKCGKHRGYLQAHHKKSITKYPKLIVQIKNGQTLCKKCHEKETIKSIKNGWKEIKNRKTDY